jgi:ribosomal protein L20A (L18A)
MQAFQVTGSFKMGRQRTRFSIETADESEDDARERVVSTLGSRHNISRDLVTIEDVEAIDADDVEDPAVAKRLEEA